LKFSSFSRSKKKKKSEASVPLRKKRARELTGLSPRLWSTNFQDDTSDLLAQVAMVSKRTNRGLVQNRRKEGNSLFLPMGIAARMKRGLQSMT
jgi:hypothetical protein